MPSSIRLLYLVYQYDFVNNNNRQILHQYFNVTIDITKPLFILFQGVLKTIHIYEILNILRIVVQVITNDRDLVILSDSVITIVVGHLNHDVHDIPLKHRRENSVSVLILVDERNSEVFGRHSKYINSITKSIFISNRTFLFRLYIFLWIHNYR